MVESGNLGNLRHLIPLVTCLNSTVQLAESCVPSALRPTESKAFRLSSSLKRRGISGKLDEAHLTALGGFNAKPAPQNKTC